MKKALVYICDYIIYLIIGGCITSLGLYISSFYYDDIYSAFNSFGVGASIWIGQFFWFLYLFYKKRDVYHISVVLIPVLLLPIVFNLDSALRIIGIFVHLSSSFFIAYLVQIFYKSRQQNSE